ncbi:MAG: type III-A CRISPR-associated RAMP protein Csm3, partial [Spirochaetota bacterium]
YIPGSSLKGKMRSLLELNMNQFDKSGGPCNCGGCIICKTFGNTNKDSKVGITRAIFRDAFLDRESINMLKQRNILATEAKMENTINRINGKAMNPRQSERVIAGLSFDFEISVRIFKEDNDGKEITNLIKKGLQLLEQDALGGSGSRGYGKVQFKDVMMDDKPL